MEAYLWIGGIALLAIVGGGLFFAIQRLVSWQSLGSLATIIFNALLPVILKRKSPEEEKLDKEAWRRGERRPDKFNRHPGEH